jgi:capsular polysaccharide biosynthesis protein
VLLFAAVLALTVAGTYEQLVFEQDVNREVQQTLGASQYSALELTGVQTNYGVNALRDDPVVTVTVSRTSEREYEELARALQENISDRTNRPVAVNVRFVDYEEATPPDEAARPGTLLNWLRSWFSRLSVASTGNPRPEPAPHAAQFVGERPQSA